MLLLLWLSGIMLLAYSLFIGWAAFHFYRIAPITGSSALQLPNVTVIVPARNEATTLNKCLAAISLQDYPQELLEVIVVDDDSEDDTSAVVKRWMPAHENWHLLHTKDAPDRGSKKTAISWAVKHARGEVILQTDADTYAGKYWVSSMVIGWDPEEGLRSGPVLLEPATPVFGHLQSLEYIGLVTLGAGSMQGNTPNMVNGANLAYSRDAFLDVGGFAGVDHFASGDDEMLLQKIMAAGYPVRFVKAREAVVYSYTQPDWQAFSRQRLRWVSKARHYHNRKTNLVQLVAYLGFWFFPVSTAFACIHPSYFWLPLAGLAAKCLFDLPLMYLGANFFNRLSLLKWFLPLQMLYIPYVLWVGIAGNLIKTYRWKGREVA